MTGFQFYNQLDPGAKKKKKIQKTKLKLTCKSRLMVLNQELRPRLD